jgi:hypothetical protein
VLDALGAQRSRALMSLLADFLDAVEGSEASSEVNSPLR